MKTQKTYLIGILLLVFCLLGAGIQTTQAQTGGGYNLEWNTLESGGMAAGGSYSLTGSIGQPDASGALTGSGYSLTGGFWNGIPAYQINLPTVLK